jgi:methylenetetrahydrofolate reductase (NADPH)
MRNSIAERLLSYHNLPSAHGSKVTRLALFFEDLFKVPLFHFQRCGECILSSTASSAARTVPNDCATAPAGAQAPTDRASVSGEKMRLVSHLLRSATLHRVSLLYKTNKIHNWNLEKTSAWLNVLRKRIDPPIWFVRRDREKSKEAIRVGPQRKD